MVSVCVWQSFSLHIYTPTDWGLREDKVIFISTQGNNNQEVTGKDELE